MKYLDNRLRDTTSFMGHWFQHHINPEIVSLEVQSGYFSIDALEPFADDLHSAGKNGASIHLVFGANQRQLSDSDLRRTLELIEPFSDSSLTVVAFSDGLFHPKVALVENSENEFSCLVGSGNMTSGGMSKNIEAFLGLDSTEDNCMDIIEEIQNASAYWRSDPSPRGAFPVCTLNDIVELLDKNIICTEEDRKFERSHHNQTNKALNTVGKNWKPARRDQTADDWITIAQQNRDDLGEIIEYVDVELVDGRYRLARFHHRNPKKTNYIPVTINLRSFQVSRANKTFLHRVIDDTGLDQMIKYREKPNAKDPERGPKSLSYNIIKELKKR